MADARGRRNEPRREDVAARRLIEQNRATIRRLADRLTGGGYSASRARPEEPKPAGLIVRAVGAVATPAADATPRPYVRISPNDRVVVADRETGRQLHFLGELRRVDGERRFVLAIRENGFFAAVDAGVGAALAGLDGVRLGRDYDEEHLAADIGKSLGVA